MSCRCCDFCKSRICWRAIVISALKCRVGQVNSSLRTVTAKI